MGLPRRHGFDLRIRRIRAGQEQPGEHRRRQHRRVELRPRRAGYSDGAAFSGPGGRYAPNAWGLCDMHGNVAEWCLSTYGPIRIAGTTAATTPAPGLKVVRGGSWNDTMPRAASASRWRYQAYQPVYNVGFRVLLDTKTKAAEVAAK